MLLEFLLNFLRKLLGISLPDKLAFPRDLG